MLQRFYVTVLSHSRTEEAIGGNRLLPFRLAEARHVERQCISAVAERSEM